MDAREPSDERRRALEILRRHGEDVTSFQLLEPGFSYWFEGDAFVAYVDTGRAWVAGGGPVAPRDALARVTRAFAEAARAAGRRVSFFAVSDRLTAASDLPCVHVGEQPFWDPSAWPGVLRANRSLRYQVRRAEKKGVSVRRVDAAAMADASSRERVEVEALVTAWLEERPLAPMGFLVDVAPFDFPEERLYLVAERDGRVLGFLGAVPIFARRGWFLEDLLRARDAPNGTAELLVHEAMTRAAAEGAELVSLGLAPLAGEVPKRLRLARALSRPLYDFGGLHAFKAKLRPDGWEPMFVAAAPGRSPWVALYDGLTAFARGSVLRFGVATIARGPVAIVWALTALLVVWTPLLAVAPTETWFPSPAVHAAWVVFDVALGAGLVILLRRFRPALALALAIAVTADAVVTTIQAVLFNLPRARGALDVALVAIACAGPSIASLALWGLLERRRELQP